MSLIQVLDNEIFKLVQNGDPCDVGIQNTKNWEEVPAKNSDMGRICKRITNYKASLIDSIFKKAEFQCGSPTTTHSGYESSSNLNLASAMTDYAVPNIILPASATSTMSMGASTAFNLYYVLPTIPFPEFSKSVMEKQGPDSCVTKILNLTQYVYNATEAERSLYITHPTYMNGSRIEKENIFKEAKKLAKGAKKFGKLDHVGLMLFKPKFLNSETYEPIRTAKKDTIPE
jgi:hypothetical protein